MMEDNILPVIMCGGTGSRLWPLSRKSFPKQFLSLDDNKYSLLQNTQLRLQKLKNLDSPILICNEEHRFIVAEQMREIEITPFSILLEPFGRNTAPTITLAALKALELKENADPIILVLSSDHIINKTENFLKAIKAGVGYAKKDRLVTFGVIPRSPHTGYGYIKSENPFDLEKISGEKIVEFTEKPNAELAEKFILDKRFSWNSGIFMFKATTILNEFKKHAPLVLELCKESLSKSKFDLDFQRLNKEAFKKCPNISIDYSIMEKSNKGTVLPLDAGWSDIGSWESLWENSEKDNNGNVVQGKVVNLFSNNSFLSSNSRLLVGIGLQNIIAVETNDAILITKKSESQKVKDIVKKLKEIEFSEGEKHLKIFRPWGFYISIAQESTWQVKMIEVKPNGKLSLQMHHHRSEHWVIVKGRAKVELESKVEYLNENQSIYIPLGSKHRLTNPGKIPLVLIEVQSGSYVGEDDIVRYDDKYGR
ncbi:mannose-1-phosphate guanylyltransferase/mannose-6-phosphate isomerase [Prochlorococcus marinus XMU1414]|uniref:mannose-1-phosphate guanylyltransferase n=2 Tax=Prochlorococcus marinus TaxID=1219 RepID=A0A9D9BVY2_PROMR|nr:mannose-1-phosphate guanylyltransferase/mannose-6-phosphate isomerase [Prochlorococcus marinus]MBO8228663.1 mannose-1-phosphate guanylyltransferase/mannose-6-phosphate isomerase [Prochlorococcus marinus XMU1414]MBW3046142.1 mannose-1-phosphate guanylyltransferase/mannose-6-phosphate isomerase [Prochlorococcus marinus str. MU1414]MCR8531566.1 mannose-1-phosphate guanylyltransferase/mannose-6-phosphate isomerase [Prochlorococcus marinus XMU1420]MCR8535295.1 mannose-1-phosphate guanylyltransfer